jgi:lipooligosaccharide transport system permease protein
MATPAALRFFERQARVYRHTWRGSVVSTFVQPVLYLLAMGLGLGSLVDRQGGPEGLPYLVWLAPGLLAAAAMQTGAGEGAWPVMAGIRWVKFYQAALATPLTVRDVVWGHFGWVATRLGMVAVVYVGVMWAFGAVDLLSGLAAVLPAVLVGLAFAGPVTAYTAGLEREAGLSSLFRFGIVPLFLFSGTFFPITQLPGWLQPLAAFTPLWHGVELTRWVALGLPTAFPPTVHVAVLVSLFASGVWLSMVRLTRRLVV